MAKPHSGLVLCMLLPLPPPISSFPTYTSIGLIWIPAPTAQNSPMTGWDYFLADEVIQILPVWGMGWDRASRLGSGLKDCSFFTLPAADDSRAEYP